MCVEVQPNEYGHDPQRRRETLDGWGNPLDDFGASLPAAADRSKVQGRLPSYFVPRGIGPSQSEAAARSKGKIVRQSGAKGDEPLRRARAAPLALPKKNRAACGGSASLSIAPEALKSRLWGDISKLKECSCSPLAGELIPAPPLSFTRDNRKPKSRKGWVLAMLAASRCAWLWSRLRRPCAFPSSGSLILAKAAPVAGIKPNILNRLQRLTAFQTP